MSLITPRREEVLRRRFDRDPHETGEELRVVELLLGLASVNLELMVSGNGLAT